MWDGEERAGAVLRANPLVLSAWLFGSTQTGRARPGSDIDIGILTRRSLHWTEFADLQQELVGALGTDGVDLTVLNEAGPILRFEAVRGQILVCKDRERNAAFVSLAAREYEESLARIESFRSMRGPDPTVLP